MNERIKALADLATRPVKTADGRILGEHLDTLVFAELIVKECAETVQDFVDHRFPASEYYIKLKRYFGVEE